MLDQRDEVAAGLELERWDGSPDHRELAAFLTAHTGVEVAGHRVVHGGRAFTGPVVIDKEVLAGISALTELAPLHQPRALAGIEAVARLLPRVPAVACFDTAFHAGIPPPAASYALPATWTQRFGLRRYGFHGLSHAYAARRAAELASAADSEPMAELRLVTCHLGPARRSLRSLAAGAWTPRWDSRRWKAWSWRPGAAVSTLA